jgi:hypothetical protein
MLDVIHTRNPAALLDLEHIAFEATSPHIE